MGVFGPDGDYLGVVAAPLSDADEFKSINDRWGHAAKDEALRRVCTALIKDVGAPGAVVRVGGDEFLCIIPVPKATNSRGG